MIKDYVNIQYLLLLFIVCVLAEGSGGAAGHQRSSSAFWEHVFRKWAGLSSCSQSGSENHRGEPVLSSDPGGSAAGPQLWMRPTCCCFVPISTSSA